MHRALGATRGAESSNIPLRVHSLFHLCLFEVNKIFILIWNNRSTLTIESHFCTWRTPNSTIPQAALYRYTPLLMQLIISLLHWAVSNMSLCFVLWQNTTFKIHTKILWFYITDYNRIDGRVIPISKLHLISGLRGGVRSYEKHDPSCFFQDKSAYPCCLQYLVSLLI